jgi:hypothetical protein
MAIPVTRWQLFPKPFSQHWARLSLDLPVDQRPQTCPGCGIAQDVTGHHHAMCSKHASRVWKRGHDHVVVRLWVLIMTCLACLSLLSKLRFCTIWILRSAVTYLQSAKLRTTRIWILTFSRRIPELVLQPYALSVLGSLMLSPISLSVKTGNTEFCMNKLITLFGPSRLIHTAKSRSTLCAISGCWLTPHR